MIRSCPAVSENVSIDFILVAVTELGKLVKVGGVLSCVVYGTFFFGT